MGLISPLTGVEEVVLAEGGGGSGGAGDWIGLEPAQVAASLPQIGATVTNGGIPENTAVGCTELGTLAHRADKSGAYKSNGAGFNDEGVVSDAWAGDGLFAGGYTVMVRKGTQDNAGSYLVATPDVAISALGASDNIKLEMYVSQPYRLSGTAYAMLQNTSGHIIRYNFNTTANDDEPVAQIQYYDGSSWYSGTQRTDPNNVSIQTIAKLRVLFDGGNDTDIVAYWNDDEIFSGQTRPDLPAQWPGWSSFGNIASIQASYWNATSYGYARVYAMRGILNGNF